MSDGVTTAFLTHTAKTADSSHKQTDLMPGLKILTISKDLDKILKMMTGVGIMMSKGMRTIVLKGTHVMIVAEIKEKRN